MNMTAGALSPRLTRLDERILSMVPGRKPGARSRWIAARLSEDPAEVRRVLRGLEHLGRVECRNGWWRRTGA